MTHEDKEKHDPPINTETSPEDGCKVEQNAVEGAFEEKKDETPPYSAFPRPRRRFILGIVTAAGFYGPLSGAIYLPALPLFEDVFSVSATVINATVSVYMVAFAIAVSITISSRAQGEGGPHKEKKR